MKVYSTNSMSTALAALLFATLGEALLCSDARGEDGFACDSTYSFDVASSANEVDSSLNFNNVCCKQDGCKMLTDEILLEVFRECPSGIDSRTGEKVYADVKVYSVAGAILTNANILLTNTMTGEDIEFSYGGTTTFALNEGGSYEISVVGIDDYVVQSEAGKDKVSGDPLMEDTVVDGIYKLSNVASDSVVEFVYVAPQLDRQVVIRAEDDYGNVISGAEVTVTDASTGTSVTYTESDTDVWDASSGNFILSLPSNSEYEFEIINVPTSLIATEEIGGDNLLDGKTIVAVTEDTSVTFVYSQATDCQTTYFGGGGVCPSGTVERGWKACYGSGCTEVECCGDRTCLTETNLSKGSICEEKRPKDDFSTIVCGDGTGVTCTATLCCTEDDLPSLDSQILDQCSSHYINIDFEDVAELRYGDDFDLDPSYRPEGISFSLTTTGSFTPYSLRSAPRIENEAGGSGNAGFYASCTGTNQHYDIDTKGTLGDYFLKLVGLSSNDIPVMPALLVTYNTHGSTQAAGMLYDIDGDFERHEQYEISIYDEDFNLLGSDFSIRGTTDSCSLNAYESTYWQFVVNSSGGVPIKYLRIDYIGKGKPQNIGMGFDNFRAFGCTKDARVLNAFV
ncbi:hypothetical protein SARC_12263 [Sphaeroforma arctica JP610]|uniref:Uncharacterized protein n=1 Tax=Sphaeroforma arctica JP610 TaxID=667725 RepID=A0A0L0FEN1_9EUKA|nr:hypothetical protein SARC_12263 [Sphaeroforma arctica JP610]KNC75205.1 hypothetical protein SARC_12263 [Sphaeroforma arctica JP610]|eukprot:XP_014149107.1 hypothetical protein SARC_12263 [Sphaeroforma arctica JP610]